MKKPTEQLKEEHSGIKLMLQILSKICEQSNSAGALPCTELEQILEFFTVFVDRCHHGKEEDLLFPALEIAGIERDGGPIGILIGEHARGRAYVKAMQECAASSNADAQKNLAGIISNGRNYITLLYQHMEKEDSVLYPIADKLLAQAQQEMLSAGFDEIELNRIGPGKHEAFHGLLNRLKNKYLP